MSGCAKSCPVITINITPYSHSKDEQSNAKIKLLAYVH
jgi:hypothetical protein